MATSPNYGWLEPDNTDLVKNGALAIRTLGNAIDTTMATMVPKSIVDAKGDLIAGTAADTAARLAVGNNGETLVADSSTSTGLRYQGSMVAGKNAVINGGFDIWQRGTSFTGSGNYYSADRWQTVRFGAVGGETYSRQVTGDTTNLPFIQYCLRMSRDSGNTNTAKLQAVQSMESFNAIPLAGKAITLSFYARKGANFSATSDLLSVALASGTGTDQNYLTVGYTGAANVINSTATLTTTWQRFTFTGTVGATATELASYFSWTPTGTAGAADYAEITGVQLEVGSVATQFSRTGGTIQGELAACQRYFQIIADGTGQSISMLAAWNSTNAYGVYQSKVTMRTTPTIYQVSGTNYFLILGNGLDNDTFDSVTALENGSPNAVRFGITSGISMTQGYSYWFQTNNASARLGLQAEL